MPVIILYFNGVRKTSPTYGLLSQVTQSPTSSPNLKRNTGVYPTFSSNRSQSSAWYDGDIQHPFTIEKADSRGQAPAGTRDVIG